MVVERVIFQVSIKIKFANDYFRQRCVVVA